MRDRKGRFKKLDDDEITFKITLLSLKRLLYFVLLIAILFPWIIIGNKFNIFKRITDLFERMMEILQRKMVYFINLKLLFIAKYLYKEFNGHYDVYFYKDFEFHSKIKIISNLNYLDLFFRKEYWINSSNIS